MKHVIVLLLLSVIAFGQEITSTKQYEALINKADKELKTTIDNAQKLRDARIRRATSLYIAALEKKKKQVMASGDLDKALAIDKQIKNLKPLLIAKTKTVESIDVDIEIDVIDKEKAIGYKLKRHPIGAHKGPNGHYYKYVEKFLSWTDAYKKAKEAAGYLAVITTQSEYDYILRLANIKLKMVSGHGTGHVWLGGTMKNGVISWITKESDNSALKRIKMKNHYTHLCIRPNDKMMSSARPSGINGSNVKMIVGYIVEWDN